MNNIVRARILIKGMRPLLQHRFGLDTIPLEKKERTGVAGNDPEEWRRSCMVTASGQLYVEPTYIFGMLRDAARYTKSGKGSIQSKVAATLQVTDDLVLLDRHFPGFPSAQKFDVNAVPVPDSDLSSLVFLHVCSVRNPNTKGRNLRYRLAASTGWHATFNLLWDKTIVSRAEMEAVCRDAGQLVGLADGRSVGFGRFSMESFDLDSGGGNAEEKAAA